MSENEFQQVLGSVSRRTREWTRAKALRSCEALYYKTVNTWSLHGQYYQQEIHPHLSVDQRYRVLQEMDKIAPLRGPGGFALHLPSDLSVPGPEEADITPGSTYSRFGHDIYALEKKECDSYNRGLTDEMPPPLLKNAAEHVVKYENRNRYEEAGECVICQENPRTYVAAPCMHFAYCGPCAKKLGSEEDTSNCAICRQDCWFYSRDYMARFDKIVHVHVS